MTELTNKEWGIIGDAYQNKHDERLELLSYGENQVRPTVTADIWVYFPKLTEISNKIPNEETSKLLYMVARDIDRIDDILLIRDEKIMLLKLIELNPRLFKQITLGAFSLYCQNHPNATIQGVLSWIREYELDFFNMVIEEINNETYDYCSIDDWRCNHINFGVRNVKTKWR